MKTTESLNDRGITVGSVVGDLTVTEFFRYGRHGSTHWTCQCACGATTVATAVQLVQKSKTTCGAHQSQLQRQHAEKKRKELTKYPDGYKAGSRLYRIWGNMRSRCLNPRCPKYKNYGGRGIKLDPRWYTYANFMQWAISTGYSDTLTIERIDVDGGYNESNCTWIPADLQARNKVGTAYLTAFGETKARATWAEDYRCAVSHRQLINRNLNGWPDELAISAPPNYRRPRAGAAHA